MSSDVIFVPVLVEDAEMFADKGYPITPIITAVRTALYGGQRDKFRCDCQSIERSHLHCSDYNNLKVDHNFLGVVYCTEERCGRELGNTL